MSEEAHAEVAKRPAPSRLAAVQAFVNTAKLLYGEERLLSPDALHRWLADQGLLAGDERMSANDLQEGIELREALRALMLTNTTGHQDVRAVAMFNRTLDRAHVHPHLEADGTPGMRSCAVGAQRALGMLAANALLAIIDGSWGRLKVCANTHCQWSFYDRSASRSSTWCEMAVCGSRAKMRAYRLRRGAADRRHRPANSGERE